MPSTTIQNPQSQQTVQTARQDSASLNLEDDAVWEETLNEKLGAPALKGAPTAEPGFFDTAWEHTKDITKGIVSSPIKAAENTSEVLAASADWVAELFGSDIKEDDKFDFDWVPDWLKPQKTSGEVAQNLAAMAIGWVTFGSKLRALGLGSKAVGALGAGQRAQSIANAALAGASLDFFVNGNTENRLSNILVQNDILNNAFTQWLSAKEDDGTLENRLKNVVEGIAYSVSTDLLMDCFRGIKKAFWTKEPVQKALVRAQTSEEIMKKASAVDGTGYLNPTGDVPLLGQVQKATKNTTEDVFWKTAASQNADDVASKAGINADWNINPKTLNAQAARAAMDFDKPIGEAMEHLHLSNTVTDTKAAYIVDEMVNTYGGNNLSSILDFTKLSKEEAESAGLNLMVSMKKIAYALEEHVLPKTVESFQIWKADVTNAAAREAATDNLSRLIECYANLGDARSWAGRALQSIKSNAKYGIKANMEGVVDAKIIKQMLLDNLDDAARLELGLTISSLQKVGHSTASIGKYALDTLKNLSSAPKTGPQIFKDYLKFYWYNSVLSGPKTHISNTIGNFINVYGVKQLDTLGESVAESVMAGNGWIDGFKMGIARNRAYREGISEAWSKAQECFLEAWKTGNPLIDATTKIDANLMKELGRPKSLLERIISAPTRALTASDECFKQLAYRGELNVQFWNKINQDATSKAILDSAKKLGNYDKALQIMKNRFFQESLGDVAIGGEQIIKAARATNAAALEEAKRLTWQAPLPQGFKWAQKAIDSMPGGFLLMPFIKTPVNIAKDALIDHNPIGIIRAFYGAKDAATKAKIWGQFSTACLLWGTAYELHSSGLVTGSGPSDKEARDALREKGWLPNSLKLGKAYVSINQLEPICAPLVLFATFFDKLNDIDPRNPQEANSYIASAFNTLAAYTTDKTFLKGLADVATAIKGNEGQVYSFMKSKAMSFVPSLFNAINTSISSDTKEGTTILSAMQSRVPGMAQSLPTRYSWLTGNPVAYPFGGGLGPFTIGFGKDDVVLETLGKSHNAMNRPPRVLGGIPLEDRDYSEFCKLHGTVKISGKTLYQRLDTLFKGNSWKRAAADLSDTTLSAQKEEMIRKVVRQYRQKATSMFYKNNPDFFQKAKELEKYKKDMNKGRIQTTVASNPIISF